MILFLKILPVIIGILCIIIAWIPDQDRRIRNPVFTDAEIIGSVMQKRYQKQNETIVYAPVVRYQTGQGEQTATAGYFVPEWQYRYHKGDKIQICYEKSQPDIFTIRNGSRYEIRKILCLTTGISILTAYAVLYLQYRS